MHFSTCKTGISDYNKIVYTLLKVNFTKGKSKFINYRYFENLNQETLYENLCKIGNSFEEFYDTFYFTLECFAPLKKTKKCANHNTFMTKDLLKAIMVRSCLRN